MKTPKELEEARAQLAAKRIEATRKEAEIVATIGALFSAEFRLREAADSFGEASSLVKRIDPIKAREYTIQQAKALAELGSLPGNADALRESQELARRIRSDDEGEAR